MGNQIELSIQTVPVKIKLLEVDGKKMTISVFKQIPKVDIDDFCNRYFEHTILGWVNREGKHLIVARNSILYKTNLPSFDGYMGGKAFLLKKEFQSKREGIKNNYELISKMFNEFIKDDNQIYIAI